VQRVSLPNKSGSYHQILPIKINLNITLLCTIRSSNWSPKFRFSDQTTRVLSPHTHYMSRPSIFLNLIALITFCEEHILRRFQLFSLLLLFLAPYCGSEAGLIKMLWNPSVSLLISRVGMAGTDICEHGSRGFGCNSNHSNQTFISVTRVNFNVTIWEQFLL
jgi:hypothetical protein